MSDKENQLKELFIITDIYDEDVAKNAMEYSQHCDLEMALAAIKYLKTAGIKSCETMDQLVKVMKIKNCEEERIEACIDVLDVCCEQNAYSPVEYIMNSIWCPNKSYYQSRYHGKHYELRLILKCLKRQYGREVLKYLVREIHQEKEESEKIAQGIKWEYLNMVCYTFERKHIIQYNYLSELTRFCWDHFEIKNFRELMFKTDMVNYEHLISKFFYCFYCGKGSVPIKFSEFRECGEFMIIRNAEYREKNAKSDEDEKRNIDKLLKLLSPLEMIKAVEDFHLNNLLSDEEMGNIKKKISKFPSFENNWLKADEEAPETSEQTLTSYFSSFFL